MAGNHRSWGGSITNNEHLVIELTPSNLPQLWYSKHWYPHLWCQLYCTRGRQWVNLHRYVLPQSTLSNSSWKALLSSTAGPCLLQSYQHRTHTASPNPCQVRTTQLWMSLLCIQPQHQQGHSSVKIMTQISLARYEQGCSKLCKMLVLIREKCIHFCAFCLIFNVFKFNK